MSATRAGGKVGALAETLRRPFSSARRAYSKKAARFVDYSGRRSGNAEIPRRYRQSRRSRLVRVPPDTAGLHGTDFDAGLKNTNTKADSRIGRLLRNASDVVAPGVPG
jgi:hypothetical protein